MYSSTLLVTLGFILLGFPALEEFERGEIAERLVRAHRVVDVFPATKLRIQLCDIPALRDHLIELLVVCAMRPLDLAVELGGARREHEERQASLLAGQLELGREFTATIHLQSRDGERHAIHQRVQEVSGGERSRAFMHFQHVPTSDHVTS